MKFISKSGRWLYREQKLTSLLKVKNKNKKKMWLLKNIYNSYCLVDVKKRCKKSGRCWVGDGLKGVYCWSREIYNRNLLNSGFYYKNHFASHSFFPHKHFFFVKWFLYCIKSLLWVFCGKLNIILINQCKIVYYEIYNLNEESGIFSYNLIFIMNQFLPQYLTQENN